jgi:hypothetical protein
VLEEEQEHWSKMQLVLPRDELAKRVTQSNEPCFKFFINSSSPDSMRRWLNECQRLEVASVMLYLLKDGH